VPPCRYLEPQVASKDPLVQSLSPFPSPSSFVNPRIGLDVLLANHRDTGRLQPQFQAVLATLIALSTNLLDVAINGVDLLVIATLSLRSYKGSGLRNLWVNGEMTDSIGRMSYDMIIHDTLFTPCIPVSERLWLGGHHMYDLSVSGIGNHDKIWCACRSPPEVREVVLHMCNFAPSHLDSVLSHHTNLKQFTCRWGLNTGAVAVHHALNFRSHPIDLPALRLSLSKHKSTLESIVLDTLESGWMIPMDQDIPAIGSLRDFIALKLLDVSGLVILGDYGDDSELEQPRLAHILPESLERLTIRAEWDEDVEEAMYNLRNDCREWLPNLKFIDCSWRPASNTTVETFVQDFAAAGIELWMQRSES
jgi:hypothetical protein